MPYRAQPYHASTKNKTFAKNHFSLPTKNIHFAARSLGHRGIKPRSREKEVNKPRRYQTAPGIGSTASE